MSKVSLWNDMYQYKRMEIEIFRFVIKSYKPHKDTVEFKSVTLDECKKFLLELALECREYSKDIADKMDWEIDL